MNETKKQEEVNVMKTFFRLDKQSIIVYIGIILGLFGLIMPVIRINDTSHGLYNDKLFLFMSLIFITISASSIYIQKSILNFISGIVQVLLSVFYTLSYKSDINKFQNMDNMFGGIFSSMLKDFMKIAVNYAPFVLVILSGILYIVAGFMGSNQTQTSL